MNFVCGWRSTRSSLFLAFGRRGLKVGCGQPRLVAGVAGAGVEPDGSIVRLPLGRRRLSSCRCADRRIRCRAARLGRRVSGARQRCISLEHEGRGRHGRWALSVSCAIRSILGCGAWSRRWRSDAADWRAIRDRDAYIFLHAPHSGRGSVSVRAAGIAYRAYLQSVPSLIPRLRTTVAQAGRKPIGCAPCWRRCCPSGCSSRWHFCRGAMTTG